MKKLQTTAFGLMPFSAERSANTVSSLLNNMKRLVLLISCVLFLLTAITAQTTKLVGMGNFGDGSIFAINDDGSNPERWIDFTSGKNPSGDLVESNGKLWGMTELGSSSNNGVIFSLDVDGTNYKTVHDFDDANGRYPFGSLVESNGKLWGMTSAGGSGGYGVVFSLELDGSNFMNVHDFDDTNGSSPKGSLVESNGRLWGMTDSGGSGGFGVIFSLDLDGNNFMNVHDFDDTNGSNPEGNLIESNTKLWGMYHYPVRFRKSGIHQLLHPDYHFLKVPW